MEKPNENWAVYKYQLSEYTTTKLDLPLDARFLHLDIKNDSVCLWVLVNIASEVSESWLLVPVVTGCRIEGNTLRYAKHVGTVLMAGGSFVIHMFALRK